KNVRQRRRSLHRLLTVVSRIPASRLTVQRQNRPASISVRCLRRRPSRASRCPDRFLKLASELCNKAEVHKKITSIFLKRNRLFVSTSICHNVFRDIYLHHIEIR